MEKSLKDSSWEFFQNYMDQISDNKIHSKLCQSASGPYIFMWRKGCLDFKYTPAFFLVGSSLAAQSFEIKLISFQGTLIDKQFIDFSHEDEKSSFTDLVNFFCSDRLKLCEGFMKNPPVNFATKHPNLFHDLLIERFEKNIVLRSRYCQIVAATNEEKSESMCLDCSSLQSRVSALISYDVFNDDPYELECDNLQIDEETMRSNLSLEQIQATLGTVLQPPSPTSISESELFGIDQELFETTSAREEAHNCSEFFIQTPPLVQSEQGILSSSTEPGSSKDSHKPSTSVVATPNVISISNIFDHSFVEVEIPIQTNLNSNGVTAVHVPIQLASPTLHIVPFSFGSRYLRRSLQAHLANRPIQAHILHALLHQTPKLQNFSDIKPPTNFSLVKHSFKLPLEENVTTRSNAIEPIISSNIGNLNCFVSLKRIEADPGAVAHLARRKKFRRLCKTCGKEYLGLHIRHIQETPCVQGHKKKEKPDCNNPNNVNKFLKKSKCLKKVKKQTKRSISLDCNKRGPKLKLKKCAVCNSEFNGLKEYQTHVKVSRDCRTVIRQMNPRFSSSKSFDIEKHGTKFQCTRCQKHFSCLASLEVHMACIHKTKMDGKKIEDEYFCDFCGQSYHHKMRLKEHIALYHNKEKWECRFCDKIFPVQNKLIVHQVSVHVKIKPFKCPECEYEASEMSIVYTHCQRRHGYRATSENIRVDFERLKTIRETLQYDYFGKTASKIRRKSRNTS